MFSHSHYIIVCLEFDYLASFFLGPDDGFLLQNVGRPISLRVFRIDNGHTVCNLSICQQSSWGIL